MIDKLRALVFKIFKKESFPGRIADKLLTKEIILYVVFGALTTVVSVVSFWAFKTLFSAIGWSGLLSKAVDGAGWQSVLSLLGKDSNYIDATLLSWVCSVLFAFFTNKLFVFESKSWKPSVAIKELAAFFSARLFSLGVELVFMFVAVSLLSINEMAAKIAVQIIIVILNYVFSKLFIFRRKKAE